MLDILQAAIAVVCCFGVAGLLAVVIVNGLKQGEDQRPWARLIKEQALALECLRLVTKSDWEHVFPVRRWKTIGPHTTIACVGWWHRLRWRRWKIWQRMVEEARPVGYDIRLGVCLW